MPTKIAINGFGRIGRCVARVLFGGSKDHDLQLVQINDLTDDATLAYLLEFDSVHRRFNKPVAAVEGGIRIGDTVVKTTAEPDPSKLPWADNDVDIVFECTGRFRTGETAGKHIAAGAKRVIVSAPGKDIDGTFCVGINTEKLTADHRIVSNASCTTNCLAPVAKLLDEEFGLIRGQMVTVHSYTNDQRILDLPHSKLRRARAAALSMIPTTTGAAQAIGLVLPHLAGKLDGSAIRVPTPNVSLVHLVAQVGRATSAEEVNAKFKAASEGALAGVLGYEERPLVSIDYCGSPESSILDAAQTQVNGGDLVSVQSWYDNEWGFSHRMIDLATKLSSL